MRVLLVEDDDVIAEGVSGLLRSDGYTVDREGSIAEATYRLDVESYDGVLLDRGLPDGDGLRLVSHIRKSQPDMPILVLTSMGQANETVSGLDSGADDYLSKPFLPDILLARLRALFRRKERPVEQPVIAVGGLSVDTNTQRVSWNGNPVPLSPREYQLLLYLVRHRGEAVDRQTLLDHVWGDTTDVFSNTVDVHIRYLRRKLHGGSLIVTVRGKGYMVCAD